MKLAIMQPYFLPYIGYFQLINAVDKFIILDDVNYINRGWINRNNILVDGKKHLFTIPLEDASQNKRINEIRISSENKWQQKFLKTTELNYKKAPHFTNVFPLIEEIITKAEEKISVFNYHSIVKVCDYIGIKTEIVPESGRYQNTEMKGQARIVDICLKEQASVYINSIGGAELYSKEQFRNNNLDLYLLNSKNVAYQQFGKEFVPALSLIDVMMFNSPENIGYLLKQYELV